MFKAKKRKCRCCKENFIPDYRTWRWQEYCAKETCRKASKAASQRRWVSKPENRDYFRGPVHVERKRCWRATHPERARARGGGKKHVPQDEMAAKVPVVVEESGRFAAVVPQDVMREQPLVLIGLIAKLTDSRSQDEIANASLSLLRLGQDIVRGAGDGSKANITFRESARGAAAV